MSVRQDLWKGIHIFREVFLTGEAPLVLFSPEKKDVAQGRLESQEKHDIEMSRLQEGVRPIFAHKLRKVDGPGIRVLSNQADMHLAIFDAV
jgi:hypothetical protein